MIDGFVNVFRRFMKLFTLLFFKGSCFSSAFAFNSIFAIVSALLSLLQSSLEFFDCLQFIISRWYFTVFHIINWFCGCSLLWNFSFFFKWMFCCVKNFFSTKHNTTIQPFHINCKIVYNILSFTCVSTLEMSLSWHYRMCIMW
jgi:hypothetical protein